MGKTWFFIGLIALGVLLVVSFWPDDSPPVGRQSDQTDAAREKAASARLSGAGESSLANDPEVEELRRRLDDEIRARRALERRLQAIEGEISRLQAAAMEGTAGVAEPVAGDSPEASDAEDERRAWFDEQALLDSGLDEASARELRLFFEQLELERLRLRDRATREGWESARTRDEFARLDDREQSLRERLGDEGYAAYLYAAGRPNRVEVTSVLASAPAGQAGIQAGDQIIRYADQRIYSPRELRAAIADGDIDELVEIEVLRDGESRRYYLSRGPLGVRTGSLSVAP